MFFGAERGEDTDGLNVDNNLLKVTFFDCGCFALTFLSSCRLCFSSLMLLLLLWSLVGEDTDAIDVDDNLLKVTFLIVAVLL